MHIRRIAGRLFEHYLSACARRPSRWLRSRLGCVCWPPDVGRRIDFLDDPDAPEANSLVPSVNVGVLNDRGEVLLIRRTDNENWAMPGGAMHIGEAIAEAGVRETREESGIECEIVRLVGVYTNPRHVMLYTSNNEVRQECSLVFAARPVGGELATSSESREVRWVAPGELDRYPMHPSMRQRVRHLFEGREGPFIASGLRGREAGRLCRGGSGARLSPSRIGVLTRSRWPGSKDRPTRASSDGSSRLAVPPGVAIGVPAREALYEKVRAVVGSDAR
jgi:ADP-ribose pyrophosphatase YjhB (NUDIX family)